MPVLPKDPVELEGCRVDLHRRLVVHDDGRTTSLTAREVDLFAYLFRNPNRTVTREELLVEVWDYSPEMVTRTVDNTIRRLRTKVERAPRQPVHVLTIFGEGYAFAGLRREAATLPDGRVALVHGRIAAFRGLEARDAETAESVLDTLDAVLSAEAESMDGFVVGHPPEVLVAFGEPRGALAFAAQLQEALHAAPWPSRLLDDDAGAAPAGAGGPWRGVRLGVGVALGTGTPTGAGYEGPAAVEAAALAEAAHGGQVLVGPTAWAAVAPARDLHVDVVPLGAHPLGEAPTPVPLMQVLPESLRARTFPPPRTRALQQTNLGAEVTSFVGRRRDLDDLRGHFARGARLVTLLGPAGAGKTRLAQKYGANRVDAMSVDGGGVWFCDLAAATTAEEVVAAVADALGVPLDPARDAEADRVQVGRALANRGSTLVLLDNAEQVVVGLVECIRAWRAAAPTVRFLVTSRTVLDLPDERIHRVAPLEPAEAIALFVDRARAVRLDFVLEQEDLLAVQNIAARLDHNPLAMELAAARVKVLPPRRLAARLAERFRTLGRGPRDGAPRHATLRDALDWSWDLLEPWARSAFAQLGAFSGGFDVNAARAVLRLPGPSAPAVPDVLTSLRDRSLLRSIEPAGLPGTVRFVLLESVQAYAEEQLAQRDDAAEVARRHLDWAVELGAGLLAGLDGDEVGTATRRLAAEVGNLRRAHALAVAHDPDAACALVVALDAALAPRGPYEGHLELINRTVELGDAASPAARVPVLLARARARRLRGNVAGTEADLLDAARSAREAGDEVAVAEALLALATWASGRGRAQDAVALLEAADARTTFDATPRLQARIAAARARHAAVRGRLAAALRQGETALDLLRRAGLRRDESELLVDVAGWASSLGDAERARALHRQALELARQRGDLRVEGRVLGWLGALLHEVGSLDAAAEHLDLAAELHRRVGDRRGAGLCEGHRGAVHAERGEADEALAALDRALAALDEIDDTRLEGWFLGWRASVLHREGRLDAAVDASRRAMARLREAGDLRMMGRVATRSALLLASMGRRPEAVRGLTEADRLLGAVSDQDGLAAMELARRHLDGHPVGVPEGGGMEVRWIGALITSPGGSA